MLTYQIVDFTVSNTQFSLERVHEKFNDLFHLCSNRSHSSHENFIFSLTEALFSDWNTDGNVRAILKYPFNCKNTKLYLSNQNIQPSAIKYYLQDRTLIGEIIISPENQ